MSVLPQFVDPDRNAGSLATFLGRRPGWLRTQRYLMGSVLGALALRLLTEKSRTAVA